MGGSVFTEKEERSSEPTLVEILANALTFIDVEDTNGNALEAIRLAYQMAKRDELQQAFVAEQLDIIEQEAVNGCVDFLKLEKAAIAAVDSWGGDQELRDLRAVLGEVRK
jgi:hypothetical protein